MFLVCVQKRGMQLTHLSAHGMPKAVQARTSVQLSSQCEAFERQASLKSS